jgi:ribosomal protein S20
MPFLQWIALWSLIATQVGAFVGMYKYFDSRINRSYERMDENKKEAEREFVRKESCKILHANTAENLIGTESRIVTRFDKLDKKVEDMFNMIIDLLKTK